MQCMIDSTVHQGEHPITTGLHAEAAVSHPDEVHALMVAVLEGLLFGNGAECGEAELDSHVTCLANRGPGALGGGVKVSGCTGVGHVFAPACEPGAYAYALHL